MGVADDEDFFDPDAQKALRFAVATSNDSDIPLEVIGVSRDDGSLDAMQCLSWVAGYACTEYSSVGVFVYHQDHEHWHFDGFALYEIRHVLPGGQPDWDGAPMLRVRKVSFCMADSAPNSNNWVSPRPPRYTEFCPGMFQGISPGWRDIYGSGVYGQQAIIEDLPDGTYALTVTTNPDRTLHESSYEDNRAFTIFDVEDGVLAEADEENT